MDPPQRLIPAEHLQWAGDSLSLMIAARVCGVAGVMTASILTWYLPLS